MLSNTTFLTGALKRLCTHLIVQRRKLPYISTLTNDNMLGEHGEAIAKAALVQISQDDRADWSSYHLFSNGGWEFKSTQKYREDPKRPVVLFNSTR